jgi:hypothetical protein
MIRQGPCGQWSQYQQQPPVRDGEEGRLAKERGVQEVVEGLKKGNVGVPVDATRELTPRWKI